MQNGRIYRKGSAWILSYAVKAQEPGGKITWARRSKRLAPYGDEYRTEASVRHLASEILAPINAKTARPESTDTVEKFIENTYLPYCQRHKPSTYNGYTYVFKTLQPHLGNYLLRNFGAVEGERLLNDFAAEKQWAQNTLKNTKGFLSGAFRYAVRIGLIKFNPMRETILPKGKPMKNTRAYPLAVIQAQLAAVPEPARTAMLVAALTGMRQSEIRGIRWEDFDGKTIQVKRSVWRKHEGDVKTPSSAAGVPVIPLLAKALELHRETSRSQYIFTGTTGRPLTLDNLTRRVIAPSLKAAGIEWSGWHGYRRGLATTLSDLGVADKVTQEVLRHASVETTRKHYIKTSSGQSKSAMKKLDKAFSRTQKRVQNRTQKRTQKRSQSGPVQASHIVPVPLKKKQIRPAP